MLIPSNVSIFTFMLLNCFVIFELIFFQLKLFLPHFNTEYLFFSDFYKIFQMKSHFTIVYIFHWSFLKVILKYRHVLVNPILSCLLSQLYHHTPSRGWNFTFSCCLCCATLFINCWTMCQSCEEPHVIFCLWTTEPFRSAFIPKHGNITYYQLTYLPGTFCMFHIFHSHFLPLAYC